MNNNHLWDSIKWDFTGRLPEKESKMINKDIRAVVDKAGVKVVADYNLHCPVHGDFIPMGTKLGVHSGVDGTVFVEDDLGHSVCVYHEGHYDITGRLKKLDKPVRELTVAEISEKLGYEVKVVK